MHSRYETPTTYPAPRYFTRNCTGCYYQSIDNASWNDANQTPQANAPRVHTYERSCLHRPY